MLKMYLDSLGINVFNTFQYVLLTFKLTIFFVFCALFYKVWF